MQKKRDSLLRPNKKGTSEEVPFKMVGQRILMVRVLWDAHLISLQNREKTGNFALFQLILWILMLFEY